MPVEKSVFISYRRANIYTARAIYQELKQRGYDVFLDYNSIDNGSFERTILNQISGRAHFILILTPKTLERCVSADDWVRREIEHALKTKRNIVPLMFDGFEFKTHGTPYLSGRLKSLSEYNAVRIHADYFEEGMDRLIERFLNVSVESTLHPIPATTSRSNDQSNTVSLVELQKAEKFFEQGQQYFQRKDWTDAINTLSKAIEINQKLSDAYYFRALTYLELNQIEQAEADLRSTIELDNQHHKAHRKLGDVLFEKKQLHQAIAAYSVSLRLNPPNISAYLGRGQARMARHDYNRAIEDFEKILKLSGGHKSAQRYLLQAKKLQSQSTSTLSKVGQLFGIKSSVVPENAQEYYNRARSRPSEEEDACIEDLSKAIEINPRFVRAYLFRASVYYHRGDFALAIQDDSRFIELKSESYLGYANRGEVYLASHKFGESIKDFRKALSIKADDVYSRTGLAIALYYDGRSKIAIKQWHSVYQEAELPETAKEIGDKLDWHPNITKLASTFLESLSEE